ncbi:gag-protease polyprotein [Cucumis melo var. makuwa]|uniref:Gag-protease polyprotein n=1 Tax=Cucumis melo var. makuwa TaxID=1194695 RepID=A0A5D3DRY2_CUCMM|nr:gag-protease polyprotein [Cucumis melo var. makuwa]TYK26487.1 gag-protease polyprotein [Cucumis melo var. makuwa]
MAGSKYRFILEITSSSLRPTDPLLNNWFKVQPINQNPSRANEKVGPLVQDLDSVLKGTTYLLSQKWVGVNFHLAPYVPSYPLGIPLGSPKTRDVPTRLQIVLVRKRTSLGVEVEVREEASWRITRSDRGKYRHVEVVGEVEELDVPSLNSNMLCIWPTLLHLSLKHISLLWRRVETKQMRDFRKYNPKMFDGSMDDPTMAQMWLTFLKTIFRYMKCPDDLKVQYTIFFLTDRGTTWWETAERMLDGYMTMEHYDAEFDMVSHFTLDVVRNEVVRIDKFVGGLRLDL